MLKILVKDGDFDYVFVATHSREVEDVVKKVFKKELWEVEWSCVEGSSIEHVLRTVHRCGVNHIYINCKGTAKKYLCRFPNFLKKDIELEQELKRIWNSGFKGEDYEVNLMSLM